MRKYTKCSGSSAVSDPVLNLRRNAFYHKNDEMRLRDSAIIELLYHEAKRNVLCGRYPRDISESYLLGGFSARIALGNFNPQQHNSTFFRYVRLLFIDQHIRKNLNPFYRLRKETEKS